MGSAAKSSALRCLAATGAAVPILALVMGPMWHPEGRGGLLPDAIP